MSKNNATCKVFAQAFFKKLVASRRRNGGRSSQRAKLLFGAFLFAKLFLLRLVCQKKKRYRRRILPVGEDIILPFFIKLNPYLFQQVIL
ncbi:MAG: hypothetical protein II292_02610, partial [Clostridia bacterium]|nr:hypothetical protein [Clostridia bacterium]